MKKISILILCFTNLSFITIGMHYSIEADVKTNCQDNFPSGLSFFFEQVGGYGDKSMVSQTESILGIDLSTFQEYDFIDNEEPSENYWKDITQFESVIDAFISKIKANPTYYQNVKYNPIILGPAFTTDSTEMKKIEQKREEYENHPMYSYPNDDEYLSSNAIMNDLETLKKILKCYKDNGATKIKLSYD